MPESGLGSTGGEVVAIPIVVVLTGIGRGIAAGRRIDAEEVLDPGGKMAWIVVGVFVLGREGQAGEVAALFAGHGGRPGCEELRHGRNRNKKSEGLDHRRDKQGKWQDAGGRFKAKEKREGGEKEGGKRGRNARVSRGISRTGNRRKYQADRWKRTIHINQPRTAPKQKTQNHTPNIYWLIDSDYLNGPRRETVRSTKSH